MKGSPLTPVRGVWEFCCPWCLREGKESWVEITPAELNCRRLIHGSVKATGAMVGPHSRKTECEALRAADAVWGCCRALLIVGQDGGMCATAVEYEG